MKRFIVIDLETTGHNPDTDAITEVGAVLIEDRQIKKVFSSFVYTDKEIPQYIQQLTGIKSEMLVDAPSLEEVMGQLLPMMEGAVFVAHNASFDLGFIQNALDEVGYRRLSGQAIDTLDLARILLPMAQSYKLSHITEDMGIVHEKHHRAEDDAVATANLLIQLLQQLEQMPIIYLQRTSELIKHFLPDLYLLLENVLATKFNRVNDDDEDNFAIFNQIALQRTEDYVEGTDDYKFEYEQFQAIFSEDGLLFHQFPNFELRPSQKEMSQAVWDAFTDSSHLMVEAGTGTGKSLAYLIPALIWAKEHQEKLVIATHTINLQEQLFDRDIPLLKEIMPFSFSATVLKGRNNYLCLRKFEYELLQSNYSQIKKEETVDLAQMLTWVALTKTGDAEEINLSLTGRDLWSQVKSDSDSCLNRYCPWFRSCFYHRARQNAQLADLIITNHSLLLTNLKSDHRILPAFSRLVIDEAHQFEGVASKHLGFELNQYQLFSLLYRQYKDAKNGFLIKVISELLQSQDPDNAVIANQIQNHLIPTISKVEGELYNYFNVLGDFVNNTVARQDSGRKTLRITSSLQENELWQEIFLLSENIYLELTEWVNQMEEVLQKLKAADAEESVVADFAGHLKDIKEAKLNFSEWNNASKKNMVFWVETAVKGRKNSSYLIAAPIDVGPYIREFIFDKLDSVILTSATLSVNNSFAYASQELGFTEEDQELRKVKLSSPFDYRKQAVLCIPKDFPKLLDSEPLYTEQLVKNISDVAISFNGRTLVLFTSHQMLQKVYGKLKETLDPLNIKVLGHGIDSNSRSKLTNRFVNDSQTVLLGTNSFWEGVDIPGEALSALVIVKLPFTPPNHPIHEAKTEKLKEEHRNPFMELSVPQAVIRFKQGFGRLIRTQRDHGVVIVFDRRIVESRYGSYFIKSLPDLGILYKPFGEIIDQVENWLKKLE